MLSKKGDYKNNYTHLSRGLNSNIMLLQNVA